MSTLALKRGEWRLLSDGGFRRDESHPLLSEINPPDSAGNVSFFRTALEDEGPVDYEIVVPLWVLAKYVQVHGHMLTPGGKAAEEEVGVGAISYYEEPSVASRTIEGDADVS